MRTQLEEIKLITDLLKDKSNESYRNLESVNTGSFHKEKEDIVTSVCSQARSARRLNQTLHSCLDDIMSGATIQDFYNHKMKQATRTNQCEQDRKESMEELEVFTDLIIEI